MRFKYLDSINNPYLLNEVKRLCEEIDNEFVPPLSSRGSTSQVDFKQIEKSDVTKYVEELKNQSILIAYKGRLRDHKSFQLAGFMSFKKDFKIEFEHKEEEMRRPNVYITTIIVDKNYRRQGITSNFYQRIFEQFKGNHIYTRTWETNHDHIRLLERLKFYEQSRIEQDRFDTINDKWVDTIYFHKLPIKQSMRQIIKQYGLQKDLLIFSVIFILTIVFYVAWTKSSLELSKELWLAIFTSLGASLITLSADLILKYNQSKNDEHISSLASFGIDNIRFSKDEVLETLIPKAKNQLWISGYRLIMTTKQPFLTAIRDACERRKGKDFRIKILLVSVFSQSYGYVYENDRSRTLDNYRKLYNLLLEMVDKYQTDIEIRFTIRPIFNDTYRVDNTFITSPFLHATDAFKEKITAKDFYSFQMSDAGSLIYNRVESDFMTIWEDSTIRYKIVPSFSYEKFITEVENKTHEAMSQGYLQDYL